MPLMTVDGIVVRNADYKENDRMITVFTKEYGAIGALVRGCRKKGSTNIACSELFAFCEFVLFENKGKHTVNSFTLKESFYPIREDFDKFSAAAFCCELVSNASEHGNERSDELFSMLYYALSYICYLDISPLDMALCFAWRFLSASGYAPMLADCSVCAENLRGNKKIAFSSSAGGALCDRCKNANLHSTVSAISLEAVRRMILLQNSEMKKVVLPEKVRAELLPITVDYAQTVTDKNLKSAKQLGR